MDKDTLVSILGPALVIGFIVIIVLAVIADKTANKRFDKKIESKYKIKEQLGGMMVTENKELLMYLGSGTLHGYKLWNIEEILYSIYDLLKKYNSNIQIIKNGDVIDR